MIQGIGQTTSTNHYKFTGKERDTESNLDDFGARYYSNGMGRFMSPDWAALPTAVPYAVLDDPQSLNLYSYVRNSPIARIDADGHQFVNEAFQDWDFDILGAGQNNSGQQTKNQPNGKKHSTTPKPFTTPAQITEIGDAVVVEQTTGTVTVNDDGSRTVVGTTTTATYSTKPGEEGTATYTTRTDTETRDKGNWLVSRSVGPTHDISAAEAGKRITGLGSDGLAKVQQSAHRNALESLPATIGKDMKAHPGKYVAIVVGAVALPVGAATVIGGALLSTVAAGAAIADDATHP